MPLIDDRHWMQEAIDLSKLCPFSEKAYSVGAIIISAVGKRISTGYSREKGYMHAEEIAIQKAKTLNEDLSHCILYTTMEPCSKRLSGTPSCSQHILEEHIPRVCFALREPPIFVQCEGERLLKEGGVHVVEMSDFAKEVKKVNMHLLKIHGID